MSDDPENLVLGLRRMDAKLDRLGDEMREVKTRLGLLEQQYAIISSRLDRLQATLDALT